jgi:hypothetical protein
MTTILRALVATVRIAGIAPSRAGERGGVEMKRIRLT